MAGEEDRSPAFEGGQSESSGEGGPVLRSVQRKKDKENTKRARGEGSQQKKEQEVRGRKDSTQGQERPGLWVSGTSAQAHRAEQLRKAAEQAKIEENWRNHLANGNSEEARPDHSKHHVEDWLKAFTPERRSHVPGTPVVFDPDRLDRLRRDANQPPSKPSSFTLPPREDWHQRSCSRSR